MAAPMSMNPDDQSQADAKANPLSMLIASGKQALASGAVSPQDAMDMHDQMSQPGSGDVLQSYLNQGKTKTDPYTFKPMTAGDLPQIAPSGKKGTQTKAQTKQTTDNKSSTTKNTLATGDEYKAMNDVLANNPDLQSQRQGIDKLQNMLGMMGSQRAPDNSWVSPLSALADAQTGSHLAAAYQPGPTQGDRNAAFIKGTEDLQKQKGQLTKDSLDALKSLKTGSTTDQTNNQLMQLLNLQTGMMNGRGDPQERMDFQAHQRNLSALKSWAKTDPGLQNLNRLDNALAVAGNVDKLTVEQFHDLQQAVRSSVTKGSGGVEERANTYYKALGLNATEAEQILTGEPQDLSLNNPFVKHVVQVAQMEQQNQRAQAAKKADLMTRGNKSVYDRRPEYKSDLDEVLGSAASAYTPDSKLGVQGTANAAAAKAPTKTASNGPPLNADLSKMSKDELKAWLSTHGG